MTVQVTVNYTDQPGSDLWTASATVNVPITVIQATISPNPIYVPAGGMVGVTVSTYPSVSPSDLALSTDNPGIAGVGGSAPNFMVNGVQPGTCMCFCSFRGRRCYPPVPVYCWQANLRISGLTGPAKLDPGAYVPLNANNDNGSTVTNGVPGNRDFDVAPNPNEKDLVSVTLDVIGLPANVPLIWNLSAPTSGHAVVKAWTDGIKTSQIGLPYSVGLTHD